MPDKVVVSLGGNAIIRRGERGTVEEQFRNASAACRCVASLVEKGLAPVITHGNGPIVGNLVIQNEALSDTIPPMPLYVCDADSEGGVGFMIQQTIYNELRRSGISRDIVTVVTQVIVDPSDPAFANPVKPIGPYYTADEAEALKARKGWRMARVDGGMRRVVASPRPLKVVEAAVVKRLSRAGVIVIAAGGGGVPVIEGPGGTLKGVDAVIDKDLSTALLALETGAKRVLDLTEVDCVFLDFGTPKATPLKVLTLKEAKKHLSKGQFAPGSMGPKIEAAIWFLEGGGREFIITSPGLAEEALSGRAGTRVVK